MTLKLYILLLYQVNEIARNTRMHWPKTDETYYHVLLGLQDKDQAIKEQITKALHY